MKSKKFVVAVIGRFIIFDIANELNNQNKLIRLYSSYPKFFFKKNYTIQKKKIYSYSYLELIKRINEKVFKFEFLNLYIKKLFGVISSSFILKEEFDTFIFFAGNSYFSDLLKKLRSKNILTVTIEGSTHANYRYKFLKKEYDNKKQKFKMNKQKSLINDTLKEYKLSDYIVVPSEFVKKTFIDQGVSEDKLIKIPFGLNINQFKREERIDKKFKVIFVGGITIRKGIDYLINAIISLHKKINIELWLVGTIDNLYKNNSYPKYIKFFGHINKNDLPWYYSQSDIFCHPSLEEGLPSTILEAMSIGLPIICTENSGGGDLVNSKNGFVVKAKSPKSIEQKILQLYHDKKLMTQMGIAAKNTSLNKFSWSNFVNSLNEKLNA